MFSCNLDAILGYNCLSLGDAKEVLLCFEPDGLGKYMATDLIFIYVKLLLWEVKAKILYFYSFCVSVPQEAGDFYRNSEKSWEDLFPYGFPSHWPEECRLA